MSSKLLFYRFGALNEPAFIRALQKNKIDYIEFTGKMQDYHADSKFAMEFVTVLHAEEIKAVFSYDYFPLISMLCEINHIPYLAWIYDCPLLTLQSETLGNAMNYLFCFDGMYAERLRMAGAQNCIHFPLASDAELLQRIEKEEKQNPALAGRYACNISFVGNLYNEKKNRLRNAQLTEYTRGFLEGVIQAQLKVYGYNFIREALQKTVIEEVQQKCALTLGELYRQDDRQLVADAVSMEVSAREREQVLARLGRSLELDLYTGSELPKELQELKIHVKGYADYEKEMPHIFHNSRINLNITSKTIESGIPLRVFDILSCGGFCLTNYQPEIAELFVDGEELVMYSDVEDLQAKVSYYLTHEEERARIARNGYERLKKEHDLAPAVRLMLEIIQSGEKINE